MDAWHASTAWSAAVLLGVAAALLLLVRGVGLLTGAWVRVVAVVLLLGLGAAVGSGGRSLILTRLACARSSA